MAKLKEHHKQISEAKNTEDTSFSMKLEETKGNSDILTPMPLKPVQTSAVTHQVIIILYSDGKTVKHFARIRFYGFLLITMTTIVLS